MPVSTANLPLAPTGEPIKDYNVNTGYSPYGVDENSPEFKDWALKNPAEAYRYWDSKRVGGYNKLGDNYYNMAQQNAQQANLTYQMRTMLNRGDPNDPNNPGDPGAIGPTSSIIDMMNASQGNGGPAQVFSPSNIHDVIRRLAEGASAGTNQAATDYFRSPSNRADIWNTMLYGMNPNNPLTQFYANSTNRNNAINSMVNGSYADFIRQRMLGI